jgi:hypothetical protein
VTLRFHLFFEQNSIWLFLQLLTRLSDAL